MKPVKKFYLSFIAFFLVTAITVGIVEAGLRLLKLFPPHDVITPQRPDLYVSDNDVGYHLWPSTSTFDRYPSTALKITDLSSNADGFRNSREFGESGSEKRLLMIGDSFVFGLGVNSQFRLTEVLESQLSGWRVDNLGMSGWGLDLMLRALETFGPKIRPNMVVLAVYTDDFRRVLPQYPGSGYSIPKYELKNGKLVSQPYQLATGWRKLHLAQAVYEIYWRKIANRNRYDLNEAILDRFYQVTKKLNAKLVLLYLPGKGNTLEDKERRRFLDTWSQTQRVPYLDLYAPIHDIGIDDTYIKGNWHWNEKGHRIAASELAKFLINNVGIEIVSH